MQSRDWQFYPGTRIRLIRGGAPDAPSPAPSSPPTPAPAAGSPAPSGGGAPDKSAAPAGDDWKAKYETLNGEYEGLKGKFSKIEPEYEAYRGFKDQKGNPLSPTQIGQIINQALTWAQQIQAGKLVDPETLKHPTAAADPFADWDNLVDPRDQAKRLADYTRQQVLEALKPELEKFQTTGRGLEQNLQTQAQMIFKLVRLAQKYPGLDVEGLVKKATEGAALSPLELLEFYAEQELKPQKFEDDKKAAIEAAKAEWKAEQDKLRTPPPTRPAPRFQRPEKPPTPAEKRGKVFGIFERNLREALSADRDKGAA